MTTKLPVSPIASVPFKNKQSLYHVKPEFTYIRRLFFYPYLRDTLQELLDNPHLFAEREVRGLCGYINHTWSNDAIKPDFRHNIGPEYGKGDINYKSHPIIFKNNLISQEMSFMRAEGYTTSKQYFDVYVSSPGEFDVHRRYLAERIVYRLTRNIAVLEKIIEEALDRPV